MFPQYVSMFLLVLYAHELDVDLHAGPRRRGIAQAVEPEVEHGSLADGDVLVLFPLTQAPTLLPLGIELLMRFMGWTAGIPIYLLLCLVECAIVMVIYYFSLIGLGNLFQSREQKILDSVTKRAA